MESRATHTLTLLALRCLRRQLHSGLGSPPRSLAGLSSSFSSVEARINGGPQGGVPFLAKLLELEVSRFERTSENVSMNDHAISRHVQSLLPFQDRLKDDRLKDDRLKDDRLKDDRLKDEWSMDKVNGGLACWIKQRSGQTGIAESDPQAASVTDRDFFSRYLQWRLYNQVSHAHVAQNPSSSSAAAASVVDIDGFLSVTTKKCSSFCFPRFLSCTSSIWNLEHSMIIPLEASSVKRKRKKKMNKHKQRKLRRRERHRN